MEYTIIASRRSGDALIVAVQGGDHDWAAYWGSCTPGANRDAAAQQVARDGDKLLEKQARAFFPNIGGYYRD